MVHGLVHTDWRVALAGLIVLYAVVFALVRALADRGTSSSARVQFRRRSRDLDQPPTAGHGWQDPERASITSVTGGGP